MTRREDLTGRTFDRLTVTGLSHTTPSGRPFWTCACACGATTTLAAYTLKAGHTRSCGCLKREHIQRTRGHALAGQRFGRLAAVRLVRRTDSHFGWECLCDCGNTKVVRGPALVSGQVQSCGCSSYVGRRPKPSKTYEVEGQRLTANDIACIAGLSPNHVRDRLRRGDAPINIMRRA